MDDEQAELYANKVVRDKASKNPCYLCEKVDCEGCEYFGKKKDKELLSRILQRQEVLRFIERRL